jgi:hypothetical protein
VLALPSYQSLSEIEFVAEIVQFVPAYFSLFQKVKGYDLAGAAFLIRMRQNEAIAARIP